MSDECDCDDDTSSISNDFSQSHNKFLDAPETHQPFAHSDADDRAFVSESDLRYILLIAQ